MLIERDDGTLARSLTSTPVPTTQSSHTTDVALFAQDRFQPNARWYVEFGGRAGSRRRRRAVQPHAARRAARVLLNKSGSAGAARRVRPVLRADAVDGRRVRRCSATCVDQRFAADGVTPLGPAVTFVHTSGDLQTPRSRTWDVGLDHRFNKFWSMHLGLLDREGSHELDRRSGPDGHGRASCGCRATAARATSAPKSACISRPATRADVNVSYTRSRAQSRSERAVELLRHDHVARVRQKRVRGRAGRRAEPPAGARPVHAVAEVAGHRHRSTGAAACRTPSPTTRSTTSGRATSLRFPTYFRLEAGIERHVKIFKFQPWIGVRVWNALDSFLPGGRAVEPRLAELRHVLQLRVSADPDHHAVRALTRDHPGAGPARRTARLGRAPPVPHRQHLRRLSARSPRSPIRTSSG